jgi:hypothetical protein
VGLLVLASGLTVLFSAVLLTPLRQVFALEALGIGELALVAAAVTAWVLLLRAAWSRRLVERSLSLPGD